MVIAVHRRLLRSAGFACVATLVALGVAGCDASPFERVNPADPGATVEITIIASRDTVTFAQPYVAFQAVVEPSTGPTNPSWESNFPGLVHQGDGVFRLVSPQATVVPIDVRVRFPAGTTVYRIWGAPAP